MNATINGDSSSNHEKISKRSGSKGKSRSNLPLGLKKKVKKHRSQFFAQENVDLDESELSYCSEGESCDQENQKKPETQKELEFQEQIASEEGKISKDSSQQKLLEQNRKLSSKVASTQPLRPISAKESGENKNRTAGRYSEGANSGYHS